VTAELEAHRREQLVGKFGVAAGTEALIQSSGENRSGHGLVDGGLDGPTAFAGIRDATRELRQRGVLAERGGGQIEQPRSDHAASAPYFRDVREIEIVLV